MLKRVNNVTALKLAKFRVIKGDADRAVSEKERKNLTNGSRKLAFAIVKYMGKGHGPCDQTALVEYLQPLAAKNKTEELSPRQYAIKHGKLHYHGVPHWACGKTLKFTKSGECVFCKADALASHKEKMARIERQAEAIAQKHGYTIDEVKAPSRLQKYHTCRKEIWQMMADEGMKYSAIARQFARNHTSVMSALGVLKKKQGKNDCQRELSFAA